MVSFIVVAVNRGFENGFILLWLRSWLISFVVAVFSILFFGPKVQYLVNNLHQAKLKKHKSIKAPRNEAN
jgi:uncharacterized paraquat-inducible protein A